MKKILLIAAAALMLHGTANAQWYALNPAWQVRTEAHTDASTIRINPAISQSPDGSVYQTGSFDCDITIGSTTLTPVATSAFLAKYSSNGAAEWAIAIQGAATITSIDSDADGVVIAGVYADEVVFGSTDGNTQTRQGQFECTAQVAGFIAVYDRDGALQNLSTVVPEMDFDLLETGMYFPLGEDLFFKPFKAVLTADKVYIGASYSAVSTVGDLTLHGRTVNVFDFMFMDITSMAVVSLDRNTLSEGELVVNVAAAEDMSYDQMQPETLNFDVDENGNVHYAFIGYGNLMAETQDGMDIISFDFDYSGNNEHGMVVGTISNGSSINWQNEIEAVEDKQNLSLLAPIAMDLNMNSYIAATFDKEFEFAGTTLSPIAVSSFLAQYDARGSEKWAVALQGAATVKAIDTDDSHVVIAGVFADEVVIGSTDGNSVTVNGAADCEAQTSGFIAVYDFDGKLISAKAVVPQMNEDLLMTGMYFPMPEDIYFRPVNLKLNNGRIYLSATYCGEEAIGETVLSGKVLNVFDFMFMDIPSMALISMDANTLSDCRIEANVAAKENMSYSQMQPESMNFAFDGNDIYLAVIGYGNLLIETPSASIPVEFSMSDDGMVEHGAVVANVTSGKYKVFNAPATDNLASFNNFKEMAVCDGKVLIAGTYCNALPFDNSLTPAGSSDMFVSVLNKSDLSGLYSATSGYAEDENCNEVMISTIMPYFTDDMLAFRGYVENFSHEAVTAIDMTYDIEGNECSTGIELALATSYLSESTGLVAMAEENGYSILSIDLSGNAEGSSYAVYGARATDNMANFYDIAEMECTADGTVLMAGTFSNTMPLNNTIEAVGNNDIFVAALVDGGVAYVAADQYSEGEGNIESCTGIVTGSDSYLGASGIVTGMNDNSLVSPLNITFDIVYGTVSLENETLINAMAMSSDGTAVVSVEDGTYTLTFGSASTLVRENTVDSSSDSYSIYGIKVDSDYHGIVIRNGRKYLQ